MKQQTKGGRDNQVTTPNQTPMLDYNQTPMLDYNLQTPEERLQLLHQLDLSCASQPMLENCANYLLHAADKSLANHKPQNNLEAKRNLELGAITETEQSAAPPTPRKGSNAYLYPTVPVPWHLPELASLLQDIERIEQAAEQVDRQTYKLRRWALELRMDAKSRIGSYEIHTHPTFSHPPEPDIEMAGVDWTNPFHIKHIVRYYSELRQSEYSKWEMEYFEGLVERTPLLPWQKHLFIRYIDGAHSITVARELGENFDKMVAPGYTSKIMRQIYRLIAQQAEKEDIVRQNGPVRKCVRCGKTFPDHSFWWRKGQSACKECLGTKRE